MMKNLIKKIILSIFFWDNHFNMNTTTMASYLFYKYNYSTIDMIFLNTESIINEISKNLKNMYFTFINNQTNDISNDINNIIDVLSNFFPHNYRHIEYHNSLVIRQAICLDIYNFLSSIPVNNIP